MMHNIKNDPADLPPIAEPVLVVFDDNEVTVEVRYRTCWSYNHRETLHKMSQDDVDHIEKWDFIEV